VIADEIMMTVNRGFRTTAGASLIVVASRKIEATLLGILYYRLR
jgi:hypothetical protein